jgi:hypothetical protein
MTPLSGSASAGKNASNPRTGRAGQPLVRKNWALAAGIGTEVAESIDESDNFAVVFRPAANLLCDRMRKIGSPALPGLYRRSES